MADIGLHNGQVLSKLENKIKTQFQAEAYIFFSDIANKILDNIADNIGFVGFTGNTQRSYCVGFYVKGNLEEVMDNHNVWTRKTIRKKIWKGDKVYLNDPYEGEARQVEGAVYVSNETGWATSMQFLHKYKPNAEFAIVVCTGTEYSVYLEKVAGLNVLSITRYNTPAISHEVFSKPARFPF